MHIVGDISGHSPQERGESTFWRSHLLQSVSILTLVCREPKSYRVLTISVNNYESNHYGQFYHRYMFLYDRNLLAVKHNYNAGDFQ
jgi:hypothetical protein